MSEVMIAEQVGATVWKVLKPFAVFIACALVGFAAAEAFEHGGPRPRLFGLSVLGQSLKTQRDEALASIPAKVSAATAAGFKGGVDQQSKLDAVAFASWQARLVKADADLALAQSQARAALIRAEVNTSKQASAAYDLGRAACGAPTDETFRDPASGPAAPGGVRDRQSAADDFADLVGAAAYAPAAQAPVPGLGH